MDENVRGQGLPSQQEVIYVPAVMLFFEQLGPACVMIIFRFISQEKLTRYHFAIGAGIEYSNGEQWPFVYDSHVATTTTTTGVNATYVPAGSSCTFSQSYALSSVRLPSLCPTDAHARLLR